MRPGVTVTKRVFADGRPIPHSHLLLNPIFKSFWIHPNLWSATGHNMNSIYSRTTRPFRIAPEKEICLATAWVLVETVAR